MLVLDHVLNSSYHIDDFDLESVAAERANIKKREFAEFQAKLDKSREPRDYSLNLDDAFPAEHFETMIKESMIETV